MKRELWTTDDLFAMIQAFAFTATLADRETAWQQGYAAALWAVAVALGVQQELRAALPGRGVT